MNVLVMYITYDQQDKALKKEKTKDENGELNKSGGKGQVMKEVVANFQKYFGKAIRVKKVT